MKIFSALLTLLVLLKSSIFALQLDREIVYFPTSKPAGAIVIMTEDKRLYYLLGDNLAYEFPIAVGKKRKDRFYGTFLISRKQEWPSWRPTRHMLEENPMLPAVISGGKHNPLGARALYLGDSPYRIHGTNNPRSIGKAASHGCIRMLNEDVKELYSIMDLWDVVFVQ